MCASEGGLETCPLGHFSPHSLTLMPTGWGSKCCHTHLPASSGLCHLPWGHSTTSTLTSAGRPYLGTRHPTPFPGPEGFSANSYPSPPPPPAQSRGGEVTTGCLPSCSPSCAVFPQTQSLTISPLFSLLFSPSLCLPVSGSLFLSLWLSIFLALYLTVKN